MGLHTVNVKTVRGERRLGHRCAKALCRAQRCQKGTALLLFSIGLVILILVPAMALGIAMHNATLSTIQAENMAQSLSYGVLTASINDSGTGVDTSPDRVNNIESVLTTQLFPRFASSVGAANRFVPDNDGYGGWLSSAAPLLGGQFRLERIDNHPLPEQRGKHFEVVPGAGSTGSLDLSDIIELCLRDTCSEYDPEKNKVGLTVLANGSVIGWSDRRLIISDPNLGRPFYAYPLHSRLIPGSINGCDTTRTGPRGIDVCRYLVSLFIAASSNNPDIKLPAQQKLENVGSFSHFEPGGSVGVEWRVPIITFYGNRVYLRTAQRGLAILTSDCLASERNRNPNALDRCVKQ